jgi:hypothetical protein
MTYIGRGEKTQTEETNRCPSRPGTAYYASRHPCLPEGLRRLIQSPTEYKLAVVKFIDENLGLIIIFAVVKDFFIQ